MNQKMFKSDRSIGDNFHYQKLKTIGKGTFGKAILCRNKKGEECVVKRVRVKSEKTMKKIVKEVEVLKTVQHSNIIVFHEVWQTDRSVYMAMEFAAGGDLEMLKLYHLQQQTYIPEKHVTQVLKQLSCALQYLHIRNILHRDIKSANVFLSSKGQIKLGDFGLSTILKSSDDFAKTQVGTPYYMSPELVRREKYSSASDVWALGVLLYEIMHFTYPFISQTLEGLHALILNGRVEHPKSAYSPFLLDMCRKCLMLSAKNRVTASEIILHIRQSEVRGKEELHLRPSEDMKNEARIAAKHQPEHVESPENCCDECRTFSEGDFDPHRISSSDGRRSHCASSSVHCGRGPECGEPIAKIGQRQFVPTPAVKSTVLKKRPNLPSLIKPANIPGDGANPKVPQKQESLALVQHEEAFNRYFILENAFRFYEKCVKQCLTSSHRVYAQGNSSKRTEFIAFS